jgi:transposase
MMLDLIDDLTARIGQLTARIDDQIAPYARAVEQLDEITGVGIISAQELIAELGVDMTRFPTPPPAKAPGPIRQGSPAACQAGLFSSQSLPRSLA